VTDVIDRDRGYAKFIRRILGSEKVAVKVGVLTDAQHEGSTKSVSEIAEIHELGLGVPARPWLRPIVDGNRGVIKLRIKRAAELVATGGMSNVDAMDLVGQSIVNDIRARIRAGIPPELAASTLRQKGEGKTTPLIATGQFIGSITHEVEITGGKRAAKIIKAIAGAERTGKKLGKRLAKAGKKAERDVKKSIKQATRSSKRTAKRTARSVTRTVKRAKRAVTRGAKKAARKLTKSTRKRKK
jgi:hypothetical protein